MIRDFIKYFSGKEVFIRYNSFKFIPVSHVEEIECYGILINIDDYIIYYSGDSNQIDKRILNDFKERKIKRIYQDTSSADYEGNVHLSFAKLKELIPMELRKYVWCMHLDGKLSIDDIEKNGFNCI